MAKRKRHRTRVEKTPAIRPRSLDPARATKGPGDGFRSIDDLRKEQIEQNEGPEKRTRRSFPADELEWETGGEAPVPLPLDRRRRHRRRTWITVAVVAGAAGLGLVIACFTPIRNRIQPPPWQPDPAREGSAAPEAHDFQSIVNAAIAAAENYFRAGSLENALAFLHDAERVRPLAESHYRSRPRESDRPRRIGIREAYLIECFSTRKRFLVTTVEMRDHSRREIVLVESANGEWRIDWEGFVDYSESSWQSFADERPAGARRFRVVVSPDDYFNYSFDDEDRFSCFKLTDRSEGDPLYGYVERGGPMESDMRLALADQKAGFMVLDLRFPEGSGEGNQVEITGVVATTWLPGVGKEFHGIVERMPLPE